MASITTLKQDADTTAAALDVALDTVAADADYDEITDGDRARYGAYFAANMPELDALLPGGLVGRRRN